MKILQVSSLYNPTPPAGYGGTERFVDFLANGLKDVYGVNSSVIAKEGSRGGNYDCFGTKPENLTETVQKVTQSANPDLIHTHIKDLGLVDYLRKLKTPTLFTIHNNVRKSSSWIDIIRDAPNHFYFSVISNSLQDRLADAFAARRITLPAEKIFMSGFGMDASKYRAYYRESTKKYFLYLGVIARYKGVLDIVKTFKGLEEQLLVVGPCNNPQEKSYFREVLEHTNHNNIRYRPGTKNEKEKIKLLQGAEALIVATGYDPLESDCHEAFGLVMLEANALGVPVIGYKQGNITDYVEDGVNSFKFDHMNEIPEILENLRTVDLAKSCLREVEKYNTPTTVGRYKKLYDKIILDSKS